MACCVSEALLCSCPRLSSSIAHQSLLSPFPAPVKATSQNQTSESSYETFRRITMRVRERERERETTWNPHETVLQADAKISLENEMLSAGWALWHLCDSSSTQGFISCHRYLDRGRGIASPPFGIRCFQRDKPMGHWNNATMFFYTLILAKMTIYPFFFFVGKSFSPRRRNFDLSEPLGSPPKLPLLLKVQ